MAFAQPAQPPILKEAEYGTSNGVFTGTYAWDLEVANHKSLTTLEALPEAVVTAFLADLPIEGSPHPYVFLASCRSTKCKHTKGTNAYRYTATYSNANSDSQQQKQGTSTNPLFDLPLVRPIAGIKTVALYKDIEGDAILNSAKDPMIDEAERQTFGFTIKTNVAALPFLIYSLVNTKSDSDITILLHNIPAGQARFVLPSDYISDPKQRNGITYYEFTFEIRVDLEDDHDGKLLDAGFRELTEDFDEDGNPFSPAQYSQKTITSKDGSEPSEPVPLRDGLVLPDPKPDDVDYVTVKRYRKADYSVLPGVY